MCFWTIFKFHEILKGAIGFFAAVALNYIIKPNHLCCQHNVLVKTPSVKRAGL